MKATLTFPNLNLASQFAIAWGRYSYQGHDRSAAGEDGSCEVTVYNVTEARAAWIENWVAENGKEAK